MSLFSSGLFVYFGDYEFQQRNEAIDHPEYSQRYPKSQSYLHQSRFTMCLEYRRQRNGCGVYQRNTSSINLRVRIHTLLSSLVKDRFSSDTLDAVKQSAALCLLRLHRTSPESLQFNNEWTARIIHLLNDQHLVCPNHVLIRRRLATICSM